jgi:aldehyde dehydrogenase (NAD(P)+)
LPRASQAPNTPPATDRQVLDESVARARDGARTLAGMDLRERVRLLQELRAGYGRLASATVEACCLAKRIVLGTPLEGEEWALGPWPVFRHFRLLLETLTALERGREVPLGEIGRTLDGRLQVELFPASALDALLFPGARAEAHLRAGVGESDMHAARASYYRRGEKLPRVVLILGAGNIAATPFLDVLSKLFNEGKACVVKMHPANAYLGPLLREAFAEAVARNFLQIVYGGADEGAYLVHHPGIDEIHLTGSAVTHDKLLWGEDPDGRAERKARRAPIHHKRITSELGCVSPVLIVPGPYLERQLAYQAEALAGAMAQNAGCNSFTPRLIVSPKGWAQRDSFLRLLEQALERAPLRMAYYPGAIMRWTRLTEGREELRTVGAAVGGMLPWTIVPGLDPADRGEPLFRTEAYCPIIAEVEIGSDDPLEYLEQAVAFVNERVTGSLSATLMAHPRTLTDRQLGPAVERAIARLRYGAVGVNAWPALLFWMASPPWGAHPSATVIDIGSGRGWTHNAVMLEEVEKSVLRHPLAAAVPSPFAPGHRSAHRLMQRLTDVERGAGWAGLPGVLDASMRG